MPRTGAASEFTRGHVLRVERATICRCALIPRRVLPQLEVERQLVDLLDRLRQVACDGSRRAPTLTIARVVLREHAGEERGLVGRSERDGGLHVPGVDVLERVQLERAARLDRARGLGRRGRCGSTVTVGDAAVIVVIVIVVATADQRGAGQTDAGDARPSQHRPSRDGATKGALPVVVARVHGIPPELITPARGCGGSPVLPRHSASEQRERTRAIVAGGATSW
jgi:hypothetical protein